MPCNMPQRSYRTSLLFLACPSKYRAVQKRFAFCFILVGVLNCLHSCAGCADCPKGTAEVVRFRALFLWGPTRHQAQIEKAQSRNDLLRARTNHSKTRPDMFPQHFMVFCNGSVWQLERGARENQNAKAAT